MCPLFIFFNCSIMAVLMKPSQTSYSRPKICRMLGAQQTWCLENSALSESECWLRLKKQKIPQEKTYICYIFSFLPWPLPKAKSWSSSHLFTLTFIKRTDKNKHVCSWSRVADWPLVSDQTRPESTESTESTGSTGSTDTTDSTDSTEITERTESTESTEITKSTESVECT